jgi:hypothetical protein
MEERIINDNYITNVIDNDREMNKANLDGLRYQQNVISQ